MSEYCRITHSATLHVNFYLETLAIEGLAYFSRVYAQMQRYVGSSELRAILYFLFQLFIRYTLDIIMYELQITIFFNEMYGLFVYIDVFIQGFNPPASDPINKIRNSRIIYYRNILSKLIFGIY